MGSPESRTFSIDDLSRSALFWQIHYYSSDRSRVSGNNGEPEVCIASGFVPYVIDNVAYYPHQSKPHDAASLASPFYPSKTAMLPYAEVSCNFIWHAICIQHIDTLIHGDVGSSLSYQLRGVAGRGGTSWPPMFTAMMMPATNLSLSL